ncbi:MAG: hypothetical protein SFW64_00495 [Alphaproteobacteria bacterium]|nr:hypothetical protein [Alphaproteobacteria bacterium]
MTRDELMERIRTDTRTKEQLFDCLIDRMRALSPVEITEGEAAQAARRLIGFCQTILMSRSERSVDSTCTGANLQNGIEDDSGVL